MEVVNCSKGEYIWYQVQKEDNLENIKQKFSVNYEAIIRNNPNIDLYEGEIIKIVFKNKLKHIVKPMETLATIAEKYDVNLGDIMRINNLTSKRVFVGQILVIKDK